MINTFTCPNMEPWPEPSISTIQANSEAVVSPVIIHTPDIQESDDLEFSIHFGITQPKSPAQDTVLPVPPITYTLLHNKELWIEFETECGLLPVRAFKHTATGWSLRHFNSPYRYDLPDNWIYYALHEIEDFNRHMPRVLETAITAGSRLQFSRTPVNEWQVQ